MDLSYGATFDYIKRITEKIMEKEVSTMGKEMQKKSKQRYVYDAYTPKEYQRTYEFLNANDTKLKSSLKLNIHLELFTPTTLSWMSSGHRSWINNSNQNKNIPYWLQNSNVSPLFTYPARDYINPTIELVDKNLKRTMIEGYNSYGITAT